MTLFSLITIVRRSRTEERRRGPSTVLAQRELCSPAGALEQTLSLPCGVCLQWLPMWSWNYIQIPTVAHVSMWSGSCPPRTLIPLYSASWMTVYCSNSHVLPVLGICRVLYLDNLYPCSLNDRLFLTFRYKSSAVSSGKTSLTSLLKNVPLFHHPCYFSCLLLVSFCACLTICYLY